MAKQKKTENRHCAAYMKSQLEKLYEEESRISKLTPGTPVYQTECKQIFREMLLHRDDRSKIPIEKDPNECFKILPIYKERRLKAFLEYMPQIAEQNRNKFPNLPLEYTLRDMHSQPVSSMPDSLFIRDNNNSSIFVTIGIALFILDELKANQTLHEALLYMPDTDDELKMVELPPLFTDSVFPNNIIKSMMYLIEHRDGEHDVYLNHTTAKRTTDTVEPLGSDQPEITPDDFELNTDEKASKIHEHATNMTYRERMDKVLSLMSPQTRETAANRFKETYYRYLETVFGIIEPICKDIDEHHSQMLVHSKRLAAIDKELEETRQKKKKDLIANRQKPNCLCLMKPEISTKLTSSYPLTYDGYSYNDIESLYKRWESIRGELARVQEETKALEQKYGEFLYYIENGHNHRFRYTEIHQEIEPMNKFRIGNPYEIAFGYFYLLDRGDNIVWLVETAGALLDIVVSHFAWTAPLNSTLRKLLQEEAPESPETKNTEGRFADHAAADNRLYEKRYTDYYDWILCDYDKVVPKDLLKQNICQIAFELGNVVMPRTLTECDNKHSKALRKSGISRKNSQTIQAMIETNYLMSQKADLHLFSENNHENTSDQTNALKKKVTQLTDDLAEAKTSLHNANKRLKEEQGRAQQIEDNAKMEHAELIELRELIYKIQNDIEHNEPESEKNIELPYTPKQNVVIYGGHATWLKAIRPLLPNVRIIEPGTKPDELLIRNADVVWMQSNAMPHTYYGKIMNVVRSQKIPVKYFAYASAEKCARQLAEDDIATSSNT